jgi:nucleoside-diphosphate kinase
MRIRKSGPLLKNLGLQPDQGNCVIIEVLSSDVILKINTLLNSGKLQQNLFYTSSKEKVEDDLRMVFEPSERTAKLQNCTVCVIRPHALISKITGKIIQDIIDNGFEITDMELLHLDSVNAQEFLEVYKGVVPEYHLMLGQITSGPLIAMEIIQGIDIVSKFREFVGPGDPDLARIIRKNSLRAKYGEDKVKDAVHCTELTEDGVLEVIFY